MTADADARGRLAGHIEQRIAHLALEYAEVARTAGFSDETLSKIRKGVGARISTYRKLERALQWAPGSVDAILAGGEATPLPAEPDPSVELESARSADPHTVAIAAILRTLPPEAQADVLRQVQDEMRRPDGDPRPKRNSA